MLSPPYPANRERRSQFFHPVTYLILAAFLAALAFVVYKRGRAHRADDEALARQLARVAPLAQTLEEDPDLSAERVAPYAEDPVTRELTYELLGRAGRLDLFPERYLGSAAAGESRLANWMEAATNLGALPAAIAHVSRELIDAPGEAPPDEYHVYRYRMPEGHWAAGEGWLLGVAGPYAAGEAPYGPAAKTATRAAVRFGEGSPRAEAQWAAAGG